MIFVENYSYTSWSCW